jgi:hypothetical protein
MEIDRLPSARRSRRPELEEETAYDFYRRTIYNPFLDYLISDLKNRFQGQSRTVFTLSKFLPRNTPSITQEDLESEVEIWTNNCINHIEIETAVETLEICYRGLFPAINCLLCILVTLPVSVSEGERSFSVLRLLKTYLRNRSGEERQSALALMYIHKHFVYDINDIINLFAEKNRKLDFRMTNSWIRP